MLNFLIISVLEAQKCWVFWVNIAKSELNLRYRNCWNLFEILRKETEFRYCHCRNSTKSMREKKKKVERENVEFRQRGYRNSSTQFCCPGVRGVRGVPEVKRKKNWQTNWGNAIAEIGKKKICNNCDNDIAKNGGGKNVVPKSGESKKKKYYVHNIFTINHMWLVIISSNLNLTLRLLF